MAGKHWARGERAAWGQKRKGQYWKAVLIAVGGGASLQREMILVRQEGNLVQYDLVSWCWSKLLDLIPVCLYF